ncbi:MAG: PepSY-associated TM helix domain-containing protein [Acidobacteriota bacterium]
MNTFRKILFWSHLVCGVVAGVVILTMSVTGVLLTYEKQLLFWADTRHYDIRPAADGARLSVEDLVAKVRGSAPATPVAVTVRSAATAPVALSIAGGKTLYANPYTGEILGDGDPGVRKLFGRITDWHRWLGVEGPGRATAKAITGACNLAFLFIVVSGLYLWFPRQLTWAHVKNVIWFRRRLPAKARDFNWHNVIGFWSMVPLFLVVISATVISYPWASNLAYRVAGEAPPPPAPPRTAPAPGRGAAPEISTKGINDLFARAAEFTPGWQSINLRLPATDDAPLTFAIDHGMGGEPQKKANLTLNRQTGEVVKWEPFTSFGPGRRFRTILRFTHTGEVLGVAGQTIAGIVTLGTIFLVWTGISLALRRFGAWRVRRVG